MSLLNETTIVLGHICADGSDVELWERHAKMEKIIGLLCSFLDSR